MTALTWQIIAGVLAVTNVLLYYLVKPQGDKLKNLEKEFRECRERSLNLGGDAKSMLHHHEETLKRHEVMINDLAGCMTKVKLELTSIKGGQDAIRSAVSRIERLLEEGGR